MTKKRGKSGPTIAKTGLSAPGPEKYRPLRILICMPSHGDVKSGTVFSVTRAMSYFNSLPYGGDKAVDIEMCKGSILPEVRTRLVSRAFRYNATHILFVDTDMRFPEDVIPRLLNHGKLIVGANYPTKEMHSRPTAYRDDDEYVGPVWTRKDSTGLEKVAHLGLGLVLVDIKVFQPLIELPFFVFEPKGPDFVMQTSEDVYFFTKARAAGVEVFVDHDLSQQVSHIGEFEYNWFFANQAQETQLKIYHDQDDKVAAE